MNVFRLVYATGQEASAGLRGARLMPQNQPPSSPADGETGDYQAFSDGGDKETLRGEAAAQEGVLAQSQLPSWTLNMSTHTQMWADVLELQLLWLRSSPGPASFHFL